MATEHFCCSLVRKERAIHPTPPGPAHAKARGRQWELVLANLDLDVHARGEVETLKRVHRLRGVVHDVEQALVHAHLEVLAAVLVLVGTTNHRVTVLLGRQRHGALHAGVRTLDGLDDLCRGLIQDAVVEGLQSDSNHLLVGHDPYFRIFVTRPEPTVRPPSRIEKVRPSSIAMGLPRVTVMSVLSPGMTLSVPAGSSMGPVTS